MTNLMVEIADGNVAATPVTPDEDCMLLIGKATGVPSENPFLIGSIDDLPSEVGSGDQLYKAAADFFEIAAGTNYKLWCYAVSTGTTTESDTTLAGPRNNSNSTFYSPYSPLESITNVEIYKDATGWATAPSPSDDLTFYTTGTYSDGSPNGAVNLISGGYYSGALPGGGTGWATGWSIGPKDFVRADLEIGPLGKASKDVNDDNVWFQAFAFAYDQSLEASSSDVETAKYRPDQAYGGLSWLHDVIKGKQMSSRFLSNGKDATFIASVPDQVAPNTVMTGAISGYASGTAYNGYKFNQIRDILGASSRTALFCAKQTSDGYETSAGVLGEIANLPRRRTLANYQAKGSWTTINLPQVDEVRSWSSANVNTLYKTMNLAVWNGGKTLGNGWEGNLNYVRVRGLLKKAISEKLQTLLMREQGLSFSREDVMLVRDSLLQIQRDFTNQGWIDGVDRVEIPVLENYLSKEDELTDAQLQTLTSIRQKGLLENVAFYYDWDGDIIKIVVSAVIGG